MLQRYNKGELMNTLTLSNEIVAISRIDFNGEEWNYLVLRKDRIFNNTQLYKVQWWSESMKFFWTQYHLSFDDAFKRFYDKVNHNSKEIDRQIQICNGLCENRFSSIHEPIETEKNIYRIDENDINQGTKVEMIDDPNSVKI